MANYMEYARSNYFRVKANTLDEFKAWVTKIGVELHTKGVGDDTYYVLIPDTYSEGGFPQEIYDEETDTYTEVDILRDLSEFLAYDSIAVIQLNGHEKLRYLIGYSIAVDSTGKTWEVSMDDIYNKVQKDRPGVEVTRAEY